MAVDEELAGVLVAVVNSNGPATKIDVGADSEVLGLEGHLGAVLLDDHLSLEESALGGSAVDLLGFGDHYASVFKEVVDDQISDSVVFEAGLNNALFEITIKS